MNNLKLYENTILVKADTKTQEFLNEWVEASKSRWLDRLQKQGTPADESSLQEQVTKGIVLPYEKTLIPQYQEIQLEFQEALDDFGVGTILNGKSNGHHH